MNWRLAANFHILYCIFAEYLTTESSLLYLSYVLGRLHEMLWWLVCERCQVVDQLVKTRLSHLRHANLSALQLGVPANYYTPLPAAVSYLSLSETPFSTVQQQDPYRILSRHTICTYFCTVCLTLLLNILLSFHPNLTFIFLLSLT